MPKDTVLKDIRGQNEANLPNAPAAAGKNYLFAIGIDDYIYCPRLFNAVNDAKAFVEVMTKQYQFDTANVKTLFNKDATYSNILNYFRTLAALITPDDNLIVYYSGHGEYDTVLKEGYWIPVEVKERDFTSYIPNSIIKSVLDAINSRHTVLIIDSCFSGSLFTSFRGISDRLETVPSRWCLTSGRNEFVSDGKPGDNSPFADALLNTLRNNKQPLSIATVCQAVIESVANGSTQTPRGEPLNVSGNKGGQFFFHPKSESAKKELVANAPKKTTDTSVGNIGYDIPDKMELNIEIECLVRVAFDKVMLLDNLEKGRVLDIVERRISNQMGVELIDASDERPFIIKTYNHAEQLVAPDTYTEWRFYIKPLKAGRHPLILKIYIVEVVNEEKLRRELVFREVVEVVTPALAPKTQPATRKLKSAGVSLVLANEGGASGTITDESTQGDIPDVITTLPRPPKARTEQVGTTTNGKVAPVKQKSSNGNRMKIIGTAAMFLLTFGLGWQYFAANTTKNPQVDKQTEVVTIKPTNPPFTDSTAVAVAEEKTHIAANVPVQPPPTPKNQNNQPAKKPNKIVPTKKQNKEDIAIIPKNNGNAASTARNANTDVAKTVPAKRESPNSPIAIKERDSATFNTKNALKDSVLAKEIRRKAAILDSIRRVELQKKKNMPHKRTENQPH
jgi:Caspase domain